MPSLEPNFLNRNRFYPFLPVGIQLVRIPRYREISGVNAYGYCSQTASGCKTVGGACRVADTPNVVRNANF